MYYHSHSIAERMRVMEFDGWMGMLENLFDSLLLHLSTVQV